jgi:hypothetical protein
VQKCDVHFSFKYHILKREFHLLMPLEKKKTKTSGFFFPLICNLHVFVVNHKVTTYPKLGIRSFGALNLLF